MRILALTPYQLGYAPGQRGSIELWQQNLTDAGIELEFSAFETDKLRRILYLNGKRVSKSVEMLRCYKERIGLLRDLDSYDAVFVYREAALLGPAFLERLIARKKPIIYQLDDPLFVPYKSPSNGVLSYLKFFGKIKEIIKISSTVIVNSSFIKEFALQYNENVWEIPSIVDTEVYKYLPDEFNSDNPKIGWSGSPTTSKNLKMIEKPLQVLSNEGQSFKFVGGSNFDLRGVKYEASTWNANTEVDDLRKIQIGLVPLPNNGWNPLKFIMKTAQYMSLGIVPVGTPLASNVEVIRHGENGFLAANDNEWEEYLRILLNEKELLKRFSKVAAKDAEEKYSLRANMPKVLDAFRSVTK